MAHRMRPCANAALSRQAAVSAGFFRAVERLVRAAHQLKKNSHRIAIDGSVVPTFPKRPRAANSHRTGYVLATESSVILNRWR